MQNHATPTTRRGGDMRRRRRNLAWPEVDDCWWRSWWCREDQGVVGGG